MSKVYNRIADAKVQRSVFNLSYVKKFTANMGNLYPVMCDEVVPGDVFTLGNEFVLRFQPLVAPILHEINAYVHYFFVPYRILWDEWEDFITGGKTGTSAAVLPRWTPTNHAKHSLWDYLGLPLALVPTGALPLDFPRRAYNRIYNEYYRDETLMTAVLETNESILPRCWEKDYFTSALTSTQRGTAPAIPLTGFGTARWNIADIIAANPITPAALTAEQGVTPSGYVFVPDGDTVAQANLHSFLEKNQIDFSTATTFNVNDLRRVTSIQKFLERNNRAGYRYTEFLKAHFNVNPRDDRLQRPEYIGGSKSPVIISEVLKTSSTDDTSPQGNLAGHGITVNQSFCGKYRANEFGLIMGLMSIMPRTVYMQGINRQWLRRTKYDFYFPEFAQLGEQAIETAEIYATDVEADNLTPFGYQGRYDEMRVKTSMVCGSFRDNLSFWHLARSFEAAPNLNATFVKCDPSAEIFAVSPDFTGEDGLLINFANLIKAYRPMPIQSNPGGTL
nr:MAG: major capsid protein [Microviridae sp.]